MGINTLADLLGTSVVDNSKQLIPVASLNGHEEVLGLYFAARWHPQSCGFTNHLVKLHSKLSDRLQVVYISSDENIQQWTTFFAKMPWLAVPFNDRSRTESLSEKYKVRSLPTLVLIDSVTGTVINPDACDDVMQDPTGARFPWKSL
jgi:nucleoredoxin